MDQSLHAAKVDKNSKISHICYNTSHLLTGLQRQEQFGAFARLGLGGALGKYHPSVFRHTFNYFQSKRAPDKGFKLTVAMNGISLAGELDKMGEGDESIDVISLHQQPTAIVASHNQVDDLVTQVQILNLTPVRDLLFLGRWNSDILPRLRTADRRTSAQRLCTPGLLGQHRRPPALIHRRHGAFKSFLLTNHTDLLPTPYCL